MAHYVTLMRWTTQGYAGLPKWRERIEEGERIIADAGGTLVGVYVTLGRYDVVEIFEAPDDEVAIEILMKLNRYGAETVDWGAASGRNCHDCNCPPGSFHHARCDVERCPRCGGQVIYCECD